MTRILMMFAAGFLTVSVWSAAAHGEVAQGASVDGADKLVAKLKALRPDIPIEKVTTSPVPGIYALELPGGTVFYGTADGRYLFAGSRTGDRPYDCGSNPMPERSTIASAS